MSNYFKTKSAMLAPGPYGDRESRPGGAAPEDNANDVLLLRSPVRPQDLALTKIASDWCNHLAEDIRPKQLVKHYPRLANRLALCWPDAQLTRNVIVSILVDRRGGRKGFPKAIDLELRKLHAQRGVLAGEKVSSILLYPDKIENGVWDWQQQATNDR